MTKERLKAYRNIRLERDKLAEMIEEMESTICSPKVPRLDGLPSGGSEPGSKVEQMVIKHAILLSRYREKMAELSQAILDVEAAIEVLEPRERSLIRLHYIQGLTWEEVCVAMNYSKALAKLKASE